MNSFRLFVFSSGTILAATAMSLVACSDDTSVEVSVAPDSGIDAAPSTDDAGMDGSPSVVDSGADDGSAEDGGETPDGALDSGNEGDLDAGLTVDIYADNLADVFCGSISRCCFGDPNGPDGGQVDGGTYDRANCESVMRMYGFDRSNEGLATADPTRLTLNQKRAVDCLKKVEQVSCQLSGAELRAAHLSCFAAIRGTVQNGSDCTHSIECAAGYCKPKNPTTPAWTVNGGTCAPLAAVGDNCGSQFDTAATDPNNVETDDVYASSICSTRGSTDTNLYCKSYDYAQDTYLARSDWKCTQSDANVGDWCSTTAWCKTGICDLSTYKCQDPFALLGTACGLLVKSKP